MRYWLMKSEPSVYSIEDLRRDKITYWDGVRNYQARNFMRDDMRKGDLVIFYHSNAEPSGAAGVASIAKEGYADFTAWDKTDKHYDPKSTEKKPLWYMVDLKHKKTFQNFVGLGQIKANSQLKDMMVAKAGCRLSVQPVEEKHFNILLKLGE